MKYAGQVAMMPTVAWFALLLLGLVVAIVYAPASGPYSRLKEWQSGLGALFGLIVVAMSAHWAADESRIAWEREHDSQAGQIARAMYFEAEQMYNPFIEIAELASGSSASAAIAAQKQDNLYCRYLRNVAGNRLDISSIGIFEANKAGIGRLAGDLGTEFVRFHFKWRELAKTLGTIPPDNCNAATSRQLDQIAALAASLTKTLDTIGRQLRASGHLK